MDLIKKVSNVLGNTIAGINEEDDAEAIEAAMNAAAQLNVHKVIDWLKTALDNIPEDATIMDLLNETYDDILDECLNVEDLFTPEVIADLEKQFSEEEP